MLKNKRSRTCSINNIPFVYDKSDVHRKSRLECMSNIQGFGICPIVDLEKPESRCKNSQRCTFGREFGRPKSPCHWNCDYAVLLSGGWNKYMNKPRHLRNIHGMYNYLRNKGRYRKENIKIFFANNATIDRKYFYHCSSYSFGIIFVSMKSEFKVFFLWAAFSEKLGYGSKLFTPLSGIECYQN